MTRSASVYFSPPLIRASDADRDESLRQLRGHWIAGRLSLDEYEERCGEAAQARYLTDLAAAVRELPAPALALAAPATIPAPAPATGPARGVTSLSLGVVGLVLLVMSFGLFCFFSLPLSLTACALGHRGRRRARGGVASMAIAGEILGLVGTLLALPILLLIVT